MNENQRAALKNLCERYNVPFREDDYRSAFDLPDGYVAGWVGGDAYGFARDDKGNTYSTVFTTIYVGCSPEGDISS